VVMTMLIESREASCTGMLRVEMVAQISQRDDTTFYYHHHHYCY